MKRVDLNDLDITHHFGGGTYVKETHIPAGWVLVSHKHTYDHLSILASGNAAINGRTFTGPAVMTIAAGEHHSVKAITNCVWYCIHATEETDPAKVDQTLIVPSDVHEMYAVAGLA
jgi:hypothetical protein